MRQILSLLKWTAILLVIASVAFAIFVGIKLNKPATTESLARDFEIRKGDTAGQVVGCSAVQELFRSGPA